MNNHQPRFLNLWQIRLPVTGVVSILHRVSGVALFLSLPFVIYLLELSLRSSEGYGLAVAIISSWPAKLLGILLLWLFSHHLFAGVRILFIDIEVGSSLIVARYTAIVVLVISVSVVMVGVLL